MEVEVIGVFGDDLMVVNAARVSLAKTVKYDLPYGLTKRDERLIHYLAASGHDSPFYHPQCSFRITAPIYVARQLMRHHVGLAVNETSRRYVKTPPVFDWPALRAAGTRKQGSLPETVPDEERLLERIQDTAQTVRALYDDLLAAGVAPECARAVLPMATETQWIWTGSLFAFANLYRQRSTPDAQSETRDVVKLIGELIGGDFPVSWPALTKNRERAG